jgi:DnaK suppressor protein
MSNLSRDQLSQLKQMLDKRYKLLRADLDEELNAKDEHTRMAAEEVPDPADSSFANLVVDLDNAAITRDVYERRAIEAAYARMDDGSYGTCIDCDTEIPFERLKVQPIAERCAPCQEVYEKTHGEVQGRGPTL